MGNYDLKFQTLDFLEREIEEKINEEIDDFMSQDHLAKTVIPDRDLLVHNYMTEIMFNIREEIEEIFDKQADELITEINDSVEAIDEWNSADPDDVWDTASTPETWDSGLDADIEELANELDEVEKRFQERKQGAGIGEHTEKTEINWGPEWEGF